MSNPTKPLNSIQTLVREPVSTLTGISYGYPKQIYDPQTGQVVWVCGSSLSDVRHTADLGFVVVDQKFGYRHEPYDPAMDNLHPLPYTRSRTERSHLHFVCNDVEIGSADPMNFCSPYRGKHKVFSSSTVPEQLPFLPLTPELENTAISKLNERLDESKSITVNYAMMYGERREALTMITQRTRQVASVLSALRKGKFEKAYRNLFGKSRKFKGERTKDRAARLWLEWTYGWSPLLGDIHNALRDFTREPPQPLLIVKGKSRTNVTTNTVESASFGASRYVTLRIPIKAMTIRDTRLVYTSCYKMNMRQLVSLSSAGIADPLTTAWELVPFSFIADWFINVGDYLRDMSIAHGLSHLYTTKSVTMKVTTSAARKLTKAQGTNNSYREYVNAEGFPFYESESVVFTRSISSVRPRLELAVNSDPFSLRRAISALALSNQLVKGFGTVKR